MRSRIRFPGFLLAALAAGALLMACATDPAYLKQARDYVNEGRGEEALAVLDKAYQENPGEYAARNEYFRLRELLAAQWLSQAETLRLSGQFELAEMLYQRVLKQNAANPRARAGLVQVEADKRHRAIVAVAEKLLKAERYPEAQDVLRPVLAENPEHREAQRLQRRIDEKLVKPAITTVQLRTTTPISLELRDVVLRSAFDILSRASGISFVLDKDVRPDLRTTIVVRNATVEEALQLILISNQLARKVLSEDTVFVFPNTPAKLREHQELVVKSFYLANADVKQTANMIRTLVKTRDIFIDEKLNLLVIKDTPNAVRLAERLVAAQDLAEPEVMLEVEVLEVSSNRLLELGMRFPDSVAWSLVGGGEASTPGVVTLPEWLNRNSNLVQLTFTNPLFLLTLRQTDGSTSVLANPRIRVKNREKAKIHIGDRVPVITTTAAATGGFVSESVSYLDVGLKLEVEPLIYLEDEVGIKVGLEVSNIVSEVRSTTATTGGTLAYQIGTRNATTTLRLRDGETQILAGLISNEDRRSASRVPGIGDFPVVGRLFSATRDTLDKTEIVLLITPRLVRTLTRPDVRSIEFAAGTEAATGAVPLGVVPPTPPLTVTPPSPHPFAPPSAIPPRVPPAAPPQPTPVPGAAVVPFGGVQPESQQQR